ncbi:MAG: CDC48 family AAA ATPase [Candidatus Hydrothermarchaeota archaeon]|nr:CDC48 family AAA ATPase [Candidatus Hydrothermarchaeota archaeon]
MEKIELKVAEARANDVGRGIARVDPAITDKLGLTSGDVLQITGKKKTVAISWPGYPEDSKLGIIRLDGSTRRNAGAGIDDRVAVKKIEAKHAAKIKLAPTEPLRIVGGESYLRQFLENRVVTRGDLIEINLMGRKIGLIIVAAQPHAEAVIISYETEVEISEKPARETEARIPRITYEDIGGLRDEVQKVREMIELPLKHPEIFERLGVEAPKGVLLHGPPGCGKTLLAKAVANETEANFSSISGPEIMSKFYGESEENLRKMFKEAEENAPSIIFIDELDSIAPKREEVTGEVERRVVAQLLAMMDGLESRGQVVVIGATNRPNAIDPALRRPGRFDREIVIGVPDRNGRKEILQIHTRGMPLAEDVNLDELANVTHGFVGADLEALCKESAMGTLRKVLPEIDLKEETIPPSILEKLQVTKEDFIEALKLVEPSALREVFIEIPDVRWDDVGGLQEIKQELREAVEWPIKHPRAFTKMGITPPKGVLIFGPPGCGKTLLAKAIANESESNFISVKGPEILSKWVGESEKAVRQIFKKAKQAAPTIVFIDELDAISSMRGLEVGSRVGERVLNQLLTEMDGMEELHSVIVIAATNRPDMLDPALLRPGRFDKLLLVPAPDEDARLEIFKVHTKNMPLDESVDLNKLVKQTNSYAGADIEGLCREAAMLAIRESLVGGDLETKKVGTEHFAEAMKKIRPSVTKEVALSYEGFLRRCETKELEKLSYMR